MKKITLSLFIGMIISIGASAQYSWIQKANFINTETTCAVGFSIGKYGFAGSGDIIWAGNPFYRYDTSSNTWTQIPDMPGPGIVCAVSFVINGKGYVSTGWTNGAYVNSLFEYDTTTNNWTQKSDLPSGARSHGCGFSINGKGYVCLGQLENHTFLDEVWEYNPANDTWTQKASFPGGARINAKGFYANGKGYIIGGHTSSGNFPNDVWEYNPITNIWVQKNNFPGSVRNFAVCFTIDNYSYFGTGNTPTGTQLTDFWGYNPNFDSWSQIDSITSVGRMACFSFSIGNRGYVGSGISGTNTYLTDVWEYSPDKDNMANCLPPSAITTYTYCQGEIAAQLTATGVNLLWYNDSVGGTGNITAPTPSTNNPGTFHYYVSQTIGVCESQRTEITVAVIEKPLAPIATTNYTYCQGDNVLQLTATGTNLLWYNDSIGGTGSPTAPIPPTTITDTLNYYVSQTINGCESQRTLIIVYVFPIPQTPVITLVYPYLISNETEGNQWYYQGSGLIPGADSNVYAPLFEGYYYVIVTVNGCSSDTSNIVEYKPTGVECIDDQREIQIYPNPFYYELILESDNNIKALDFEIYNSFGALIHKGSLIKQTIIQTISYEPGFYLIKLNNSITWKLVKQ